MCRDHDWYMQPPPACSREHYDNAVQYSLTLTKPPGSLGRLETLAAEIAAMRATDRPDVERPRIVIFAADHGVAEAGVSAFPQVVTGEMVKNFSAGGAAITVMAGQLDVPFHVVNVGSVQPLPAMPHVSDRRIAAGTANFAEGPAMTADACQQALAIGADVIDDAPQAGCFIGGEMGIANTTSAAAIASALLALAPEQMTGRGTGVDDAGLRRKTAVIERALNVHREHLTTPFGVLQHLGGFEIAALAGAYIRAAQSRMPILVDGFICTVAALVACRLNPGVREYCLFAHRSEEAGHSAVLAALHAEPLLTLRMRLGEGSGAALALPLLRMACATHNQMASFASAGVSGADTGE